MDIILHTILPFAGILIVLIVIHEMGHYITAKLTGVKVLEAGLGYPPRIWGFTWRGPLPPINWPPRGGFVRLLGEEDPSAPASLAAKPRWVRLIVLFAGSGMNFLLPIILFALAFMIPRDVSVGLTQITGVAPQSPAQEAGLQPGDVIFAIDGDKGRNVREVSMAIRLNVGETVDFNVKHSDGVVENNPVHARR